MKIKVLVRISLLVGLFFMGPQIKAQESKIVSETWYLRSLEIEHNIYYYPYGIEVKMNFDEDTGTFISTGVLNTIEGNTLFNDDLSQVSLSDVSITGQECDVTNCDLEILFYVFLTNESLEPKVFDYSCSEGFSSSSIFRLRDSNGSFATFASTPIEPISEYAFQTWYLYRATGDVDDSVLIFGGEDVPKFTLNTDFTFSENENCEFNGVVEYAWDEHNQPFFHVKEDQSACESQGSFTSFYESSLHFISDITENELVTSFAPGFTDTYRNRVTPLGVDEFSLQKINVSPNPTNAVTTIHYEGGEIDQWEMYDLSGKLMMSRSNDERDINLVNLETGMYILIIKSGERSVVRKVIKN